MEDRKARRFFLASIAVLALGSCFMWGYASRHRGSWPHELIVDGHTAARSLAQYGRIMPINLMNPAPSDAAPVHAMVHQPDRMLPGWYVVLGWDADYGCHSARLLDDVGHLHHTWPIDYGRLDDDGPLNGSDAPHGLLVMADGSLIVVFDNADVMARLDPCGEPLWVRSGVFHHSLNRDDDGTVWTWHSVGTPSAHHQEMLRFDPATGEALETIALLDDVFSHGAEAELVLGLPTDYGFRRFQRTPTDPTGMDLFHPNDVEPLAADMAAAFPRFEAGDLLFSLRNLDLVAVIDRRTHQLKWWRHGPWIEQHDPDFRSDGLISVYSNNPYRGRSNLIVVDPNTGQVHDPLRGSETRFYSGAMGKHQTLPGGNILIVVPEEGRVLIAAPDGGRVAEFNNLVDRLPGVHGHVANAVWLPPDFFTTPPACR